jgi:CheY-like chemotaxis protein
MTRAQVLIVEDDAIVGQDLKNRLTNMGYFIICVTSTGEDAVEKARHHMPDVVLMDIRLAGKMDGITAAAQIGEKYHIPVVYLSAYADDETLARARETHPAGYVLKPFDPRNLYVAIEMALYNRPQPMESKIS